MNRTKLNKFLESLHASFWFIPSLMVTLAIGLAFTVVDIDQNLDFDVIQKLALAYSLGPSGSRAILSAIAGSMITVATTAFSITIVALQLASSQFGPRLLRNFMQDTGNQIVLGTFISTFVYSLLVLRTVNGISENEFVPQIAITGGIILAIASVGVLIYFIHHAASSIQVDQVIAKVGHELDSGIDRLFPKKIGQDALENQQGEDDVPEDFEHESYSVCSSESSYVQAIDQEQLMKIAIEHGLLFHVQHRPGQFIVKGDPLIKCYPRSRISKKLVKQINSAFVSGSQRTEQQDVEFSVDQLVEIAARALSPGINDPFTAIRCVDQLTASLCHLAQKEIPSPFRYDDSNRLRVIAEPVTFTDITNAAFNQIRQYGASSAAVTIRLLEAITTIALHAHTDEQRKILRRQADMILRGSKEGLSEELDQQDVTERYEQALSAIAHS